MVFVSCNELATFEKVWLQHVPELLDANKEPSATWVICLGSDMTAAARKIGTLIPHTENTVVVTEKKSLDSE